KPSSGSGCGKTSITPVKPSWRQCAFACGSRRFRSRFIPGSKAPPRSPAPCATASLSCGRWCGPGCAERGDWTIVLRCRALRVHLRVTLGRNKNQGVRRFASLAPVVCALAFIIVAAGCGDVSRDARAGSITPIVARDSTWAPPTPPATTLPRLEDLQPDLAAAANAYQVPGVVPPTADAGAALSTGAAPAPPPIPVARSMLAELPIYAGSADASPARRLGNPTEFGSPLTLLVLGSEGPSLQVVLPVRPNGAVGWVRATDVELTSIDDRIDIDLTARMLTWTRAGAPLMQHAVAVGAPSSPTPVGLFFVTDVVREDAAGQ